MSIASQSCLRERLAIEQEEAERLHFVQSTSVDDRGVDEIDRRLVIDPHDHHSASRLSDGDLAGILDLLDELQVGKEESCPTER